MEYFLCEFPSLRENNGHVQLIQLLFCAVHKIYNYVLSSKYQCILTYTTTAILTFHKDLTNLLAMHKPYTHPGLSARCFQVWKESTKQSKIHTALKRNGNLNCLAQTLCYNPSCSFTYKMITYISVNHDILKCKPSFIDHMLSLSVFTQRNLQTCTLL